MFKQLKEDMAKAKVGIIAVIIFFMVTSIIMIILSIVIILKISKLSITNNYNIDHVDTVVIQDAGEKPILKNNE